MRWAALLCATCACGPAVLGIDAQLVTRTCSGADPLQGATQLHFHLTGDGLEPQDVTVALSDGRAQIPNVAVGRNRRLTVEALAGGKVHARADSGPFDALGPGDVRLRLFLRATDTFTADSDATGAACTHLTTARAGHAMALLPDGRVLISGGYGFDGSTPPRLVYHDDAEIFDPATGAFTQVAARATLRRAGHSALAVGGRVLLAGGEGRAGASGDGPVQAIGPLDVFDGAAWSELPAPQRTHAAAAVDPHTGAALLLGGQSGPDKPGVTVLDTVTAYDGAVKASSLRLRVGPLADAGAVMRTDKARGGVVLVGGRDANGNVSTQISGVVWSDAQQDFVDDPDFRDPRYVLPSPRAHHVVSLLRDAVMTAGGVTSLVLGAFDYSSATDAVTVIDPSSGLVADTGRLSQARADACGAALEDGAVIVAGGAYRDAAGIHSSAAADLVLPDGTVHAPGALLAGRHRAACLRLANGSVLVTGGMQYPDAGGPPVVLDSAEIYTPP